MAGNTVSIKVTADDSASATLKKVGDTAEDSGKKAGGLGSALGDVGKIAAGFVVGQGLLKLPGLFSGMIGGASDLNESMSKAQVVFGDSTSSIKTFADTAASKMGISKQAAYEATATFGNLFRAIGLGQQPAADLSKNIVHLSSDLASFNNLDPGEVLEKLRAGLVGEAEPLRSLGVNMNAAMVQAKGLELGLGDANGQLTEGEKVQARYAIIMEQTTTAQGDFARTSDGAANQSRILNAEMQDMQANLGSKLLPLWQKTQQVILNDVIPALEKFGNWWGQNVQPKIEAFIAWLGPELAKFMAYYQQHIKPFVDAAIAGISAIVDWVTVHWPEIWAIVGPVLRQLELGIQTTAAIVTAALDLIIDLLHGDFSAAWEDIKVIIQSFYDFWAGTLNNVLALLQGIAGAFYEGAQALGTALVTGMKHGIVDAWTTIRDAVWEAKDKAIAALGVITDWLVDVGVQIMRGLRRGIIDGIGVLADVGGLIKDKLLDFIKAPWEILSPSKVAAREIGMPIVEGIAMGMRDGVPALTYTAQGISAAIVDGLWKSDLIGGTQEALAAWDEVLQYGLQQGIELGTDELNTMFRELRGIIDSSGLSAAMKAQADGALDSFIGAWLSGAGVANQDVINFIAHLVGTLHDAIPAVKAAAEVAAKEVGLPIVQGIAVGMVNGMPALLDAAGKVVNGLNFWFDEHLGQFRLGQEDEGGQIIKAIGDGALSAVPYMIASTERALKYWQSNLEQNLADGKAMAVGDIESIFEGMATAVDMAGFPDEVQFTIDNALAAMHQALVAGKGVANADVIALINVIISTLNSAAPAIQAAAAAAGVSGWQQTYVGGGQYAWEPTDTSQLKPGYQNPSTGLYWNGQNWQQGPYYPGSEQFTDTSNYEDPSLAISQAYQRAGGTTVNVHIHGNVAGPGSEQWITGIIKDAVRGGGLRGVTPI